MRILMVDDDKSILRIMEMTLGSAGFETTSTTSGEEVLKLARSNAFDLIVLDLNLPDLHGFDVLCDLRMNQISTPVLVLTGDCTGDRALRSFGLGADDVLHKPCRSEELIARIRAVVRRTNGRQSPTIRIGDLTVNVETKLVCAADLPLSLTRREYQVLEILALRKGATVTKGAFLHHMYGGRDEPDSKIIDVYVCKVRRKIAAALDNQDYIETIWGSGYAMRKPHPQERPLVLASVA